MEPHPQVKALLEELVASGRPSSMSLPLKEGRRNFEELFASLSSNDADVARTSETSIPGPADEIRIRSYAPAGQQPLPTVLFFHGGGWVFGSLETYDGVSRALASASGALLISVDFRLAPENPFPAALTDCFAALEWAHQHAGELGGDPSRLAVAGDSSGANLAASLALMARDRGGPPIAYQLLAYPALDPDMGSASYQENADDPFLSKTEMVWYWDRYLAGADRHDPYAAPSYASDLGGLPPAHVVTAGADVLRDEGEAFAARLEESDVPATVRRHDDMVHGFLMMDRYLDGAKDGIEDMGQVLQLALGETVGA